MGEPMHAWVAAMREGRFADAWALSAVAMRARDPASRDDPAQPYHLRWVWDGRPFDGRDVLVRCYHGLGDTIQFARFLPLLADRSRSVTFEVQPRLAPLLKDLPGVDRIVPFDPAHPVPPFECDIEIGELEFALAATPADSPSPYLRAARASLPPRTIGLCYSAGEWDAERCVPPALLAPLCAGRQVVTLVAEPTPLPVLNPAGCPFDLVVTASLVAGCSLVITVDTMIAHLAGAMGKPTWHVHSAHRDERSAAFARRSNDTKNRRTLDLTVSRGTPYLFANSR